MANQGASSSSAPFTKSWKYHVFLSFRGEDTRYNFTSHLYSALRQQGINTFMDDDELRRGEEISNALLTAIEDSKISVVVFSEDYASSKWCLDELVKILDCQESNQQLVIPVFYKVDPSDVRNQTGSFGNALARLESKYKDNMDKVNRWRVALSQAGKLAGFPLPDEKPLKRSEADFIQKIIEEISRHVIDRTYVKVAEYPVGMQAQVQVMNKLLDLGGNDVRMVGVWGTGGIGKTTVAKVVYNSIAHQFEGSCFLANVRERSTSHEGSVGLQENILSQILRVKNLEVPNVHIGATMIQERLSCRRVLLVLDDVDDMEQLYKLAGACDWFGVGSRIIITTRDKQLLTAHDVNLINDVNELDDDEAMELFCWHAFKRSEPLDDYAQLAERAIRYAQGLPLALTVLGSCLRGGTIDKWEAALHGFKSKKIQDVLKISYNALDDRVKQVFLDLAFFFKGKSRRYAIEALEACDCNPRYGIEVLIEKALISVEGYDSIQMHDLLEEMGKDIVEQESPTPGERSRLWRHEDIEDVLTNDTGTNKITSIMLNSSKINYEIFLDVDCFSKMKNLKIFINYNVFLSGDYLPNTLRVLDWHRCPLQSFPPNFRPKKLVVLHMPYSCIKQLESLKHFTTLTSLNLSGSESLTAIPDLSASPNIKSLDASYCESLVEVHPYVGYLDKLQELDFSSCPKLTKFPNKVGLKSLKSFRLYDCIKLESFPEIVDKMESCYELSLEGSAIKELPASIEHLTALKHLNLSRAAIKELPASVGKLAALEVLRLQDCAIEELPALIGDLIGLQNLDLSGTPIKELPSSIGHLIGLQNLNLSGTPIKELPTSIGHLIGLQNLDLSGSPIKELPSLIGHLIGLQNLDLSRTPIKELPSSIGHLIGLQNLNLSGTPIKELPSSIGHLTALEDLHLSGAAIKELPTSIGHLIGLQYLHLSGSPIKELPSLIGHLIRLQNLNLSGTPIKELPASIGDIIGLKNLNLSESSIKELPSSIGYLTALKRLHLSGAAIKELPTSIGDLIGLQYLDLSGSPIKELPSSIGQLTALKHLNLGTTAIKELPSSIGHLVVLERLDLIRTAIEELPSSIGDLTALQILDLSGCKKLVEIVVQLPASIARIYMADCISVERFSTLSKILEDGDMQHIKMMNLSNCHRLCENIGLDAAKMANILVNNQAAVEWLNGINVFLPGSEVPEWFSFRQDVGVLIPNNNAKHLFDFPIEIPWTSGLENAKLVLCTVWEITESFIVPWFFNLSFLIDGVAVSATISDTIWKAAEVWSVPEGETGAAHVALRYIPLPDIPLRAHTKPKGDDDGKSDDQLKPSNRRIITVACQGGGGLLFKSFGSHLSRMSMEK